jgi:hypothetical protein
MLNRRPKKKRGIKAHCGHAREAVELPGQGKAQGPKAAEWFLTHQLCLENLQPTHNGYLTSQELPHLTPATALIQKHP